MTDCIQVAVDDHTDHIGDLLDVVNETWGVRFTSACTRGANGITYITLLRVDDSSDQRDLLTAATSLGALLVHDDEGLHIGIRSPQWVEGSDSAAIEAHSLSIYAALAERVYGGGGEPAEADVGRTTH